MRLRRVLYRFLSIFINQGCSEPWHGTVYSFSGKLLLFFFIIGTTLVVKGQDCNVSFPNSSSLSYSTTCNLPTIPNLTLGNTVFMGDGDTFTFDSPATITIEGDLIINGGGSGKIVIPEGVTVNVGGNVYLYQKNNRCNSANACTFEVQVNGTLTVSNSFENHLMTLMWSGTGNVAINNLLENTVDGCMECSDDTCPAFPTGAGCQDNGTDCGGNDFCVDGNYGNNVPLLPDVTPPVISDCPVNQSVSITGSNCEEIISWIPPIASDNIGVSSFDSDFQPGDAFPLGTTTITYTASDARGNVSTCSFDVAVNDDIAPLITGCPDNIIADLSVSNCEASVDWTAPIVSDNCNISSFVSNHNPGDAFPVGTTTITYTATDVAGNVSTCSFDVTVNDDIAPVIEQCSPEIYILNFDNVLGLATVSWDIPVATDNCENVSLTGTHIPGGDFSIGKTTVTYTAEDASGNITACDFEVDVTGNGVPAGQPKFVRVQAGQPTEVCLEVTDPEEDPLTLKEVNYSSTNARIDLNHNANGLCFTYTSQEDFEGVEKFSVIICDDQVPAASTQVEVELEVFIDKTLTIYKAFTPDNDDINDQWQIKNIEYYPNNKVVVFDRWGSVVYSTEGYNNQSVVWDGSSNQGIFSGQRLAHPGTYFYVIDLGDGTPVRKGFVELVK